MRSFTASTRFGLGASTRLPLLACALAVALAATCSLAPTAPATPLTDKQAQAAALDREVSKLEAKYARLQEKYRGAQIELREIHGDIRRTRRELRAARADLRVAKDRLLTRAIAIYRDGAGSSQLLEVAKAGSLQDFFDKLETIERVSDQDAAILGRVRRLAERVASKERRLERARAKQARVVRTANRARRRMANVLRDRRAALNSVTAEIRAIMERQRAAAAARSNEDSKRRIADIARGDVPDAVGTSGDADSGADSDASAGSGAGIPLPPASGSASSAAGIAMGQVGTAYVPGGAAPGGFDCSGLITWAFAQAGRPGMPHSSYALAGMGVGVSLAEAQVGDIVITDGGGHAGIYVGGGSFVHAPRPGRTVTVESLGYYSIVTIRRV